MTLGTASSQGSSNINDDSNRNGNLNIDIIGNEPSTAAGVNGCVYKSYLLGQIFTLYKVSLQYHGETIMVTKRYSEFASLEKQLRDLELLSSFEYFPSKSIMGKIGNKGVIQERQEALDKFLKQLLLEESSTCRHLLLDFFNLNTRILEQGRNNNVGAANTVGAMNVNVTSLSANAIIENKKSKINKIEILKQALIDGIMIRKHCRKSKPKPRLLFVNEDFTNLCWSQQKQWKPTLSFLPIADIIEVRKGSEEDPRKAEHAGTAVLRKYSTPETIIRSFSLITSERSLDIEAPDMETFDLLYNGFKELVEKNGRFNANSTSSKKVTVVSVEKAIPKAPIMQGEQQEVIAA